MVKRNKKAKEDALLIESEDQPLTTNNSVVNHYTTTVVNQAPEVLDENKILRKGMKNSPSVKVLQHYINLNRKLWKSKPMTEDGDFGLITETAVKKLTGSPTTTVKKMKNIYALNKEKHENKGSKSFIPSLPTGNIGIDLVAAALI
jgi:hypothetical protein